MLAEESYRRLIRCRLTIGLQAEAYETYRRCRDNLSLILGIKPSPETKRLLTRRRAA